mmetsp:Transcript_8213/g.7748  ORF Transcript_8213/g.7748 Transcript_8213/m.7748 type:complete len:257 (-) Transcript_8213:497-1267(-)|eukprot:CAMPEP_0197832444 /NCGR_PEP_ID=MMETSP1437-20131217/14840_1 /TAXON_ID=49252 ORGANISM="Eucampia antarctica, Strain CCMP1452" /NCGR_SAMPLE_ID=MMETSP1437 /ASSEMBLY_ACC=CAM_ASM_001096 /LENGTH=256 /DNA_ID=CAMNT_0043435827 /DNA_START=48 /DNA_END=818 /DNA_ORIENTATION=-
MASSPTVIVSFFLVALLSISIRSAASFVSPATFVSSSRFSSNSGALFVGKSNDYDAQIAECKDVLVRTVDTKAEDPAVVLEALENLEKLMRVKRKAEPEKAAQEVLDNLTGDWRLIFTTGTKDTQDRFKAKINYFPLKAIQSFDATKNPPTIENGIYAGNLALLTFYGDFVFDLRKSKVEFDFDQVSILGWKIGIKKGDAAQIGASTGLGSESNVENAKKDKKAFFNWISADENIATARGGGGGLALWQRVVDSGS